MDFGDVDFATVGADVSVLSVLPHMFLQSPLETEGLGTLGTLKHPLRASMQLGVATQRRLGPEHLKEGESKNHPVQSVYLWFC